MTQILPHNPTSIKTSSGAEIAAWAESLGFDAARYGLRAYNREYFLMPGGCAVTGQQAQRLRVLPSAAQANKELAKVKWAIEAQDVRVWIPLGADKRPDVTELKRRAAAAGRVYLVNGEKATYTAWALGLPAFCVARGEGSYPPALGHDLAALLGAVEVWHVCDNDGPGRKAAQAARLVIESGGLVYRSIDTGTITGVPPKGDLVEVAQLAQFDAGRLVGLLEVAQEVAQDAPSAPSSSSAPRRPYDHRDDDILAQRAQAITEAMRPYFKRDYKTYWLCHSPARPGADKRPSFQFWPAAGVGRDLGDAGRDYNQAALGALLGVELPRRPRRPTRTAQAAQQQAQAAQWPPAGMAAQQRRHVSHQAAQQRPITGQYISPLIAAHDLGGRINIIESPTGTGKTEAARAWVDDISALGARVGIPARVLYVTHRVSLAKAAAGRLGLELYQDAGQYLQSADKMAITLDSLHKLAVDGKMPVFDLVLIDESEQVARHVGQRSTLSGAARVDAFKALVEVLASALTVVMMDAHAGPLTLALARAAQAQRRPGGPLPDWWRNSWRAQHGPMVIHNRADGPIAQGLSAAHAQAARPGGLPVAMGFDSRRRAESVAQMARAQGLRVLLVTSHTQDDDDVKDFLGAPNEQLSRYDLVCFSPSISTGFDIQSPVDSLWIVSEGRHLCPGDVLQAARRFRHVLAATHVFVARTAQDRSAAAQDIYKQQAQQAQATEAAIAPLVAQDAEAAQALDAAQKQQTWIRRLSALGALVDAQAQQDAARDHLAVFWGLAIDEGYDVRWAWADENGPLLDALKDARAQLDQNERAAVLACEYALSKDAYRALQMTGKATAQDRRAALRGAIETARYSALACELGAPSMTAQDYDALVKPAQRAKLRRIALYLAGQQAAAHQDAREMSYAYQERQHHMRAQAALDEALAILPRDEGGALAAATLEQRAAAWAAKWAGVIRWADDDAGQNRNDLSNAPIAAMRRYLSRYALRLQGKQRRTAQGREMFYWIDQDESQAQMWAWAEERNAWLKTRKMDDLSNTVLDSPARPAAQAHQDGPPARPGRPSGPPARPTRPSAGP